MPCDTIQVASVQLKVADMDLLFKALEALGKYPSRVIGSKESIITFGYNESFNKATGELRIRNARDAARIKQAYSAEIVKAQAKRFNWQIKETSPYCYQITKR